MSNENLNVAVQVSSQPTNKVAAAAEAAGAIGAVLVAVTNFIGPALEETLSGYLGPNTLALVTTAVTAVASYYALKYGTRVAAFNVLDKPNVPMVPITEITETTVVGTIEENPNS